MRAKITKLAKFTEFLAKFNGLIPDGKVIDHINDDKEDNRLCNLQIVTHQQYCKKATEKRGYTFAAN